MSCDLNRVCSCLTDLCSGRGGRFYTHCGAVLVAVQILDEKWSDWNKSVPDPNHTRLHVERCASKNERLQLDGGYSSTVSVCVCPRRIGYNAKGASARWTVRTRAEQTHSNVTDFADETVERVRGAPRRRKRVTLTAPARRGRGMRGGGRGSARDGAQRRARSARGDDSSSAEASDDDDDDVASSIDIAPSRSLPPPPIVSASSASKSRVVAASGDGAIAQSSSGRTKRARKTRDVLDL